MTARRGRSPHENLENATPITKEVLRDKIFHILRGWIVDGTLQPGQHIIEYVLARRLKVSRAPFREALWLLANEGLVRVEPHHGAYVTQLSTEDLEQIFELRELLEIHAAKLAHARLSPASAAEFKKALADLADAARARDVQAFSTADLRFHQALARISGNKHLERMLNGVLTQFFAYELIRDVTSNHDFRFDEVVAEHEKLVTLVLEGPEEAIQSGFRDRLRGFREYVLERFGQ